ncbi:unnamed protein product [Protopolystoma xenopodis]|uniref:Uncharacterized protein n=1 Tax=Protopolystoma xenopodis TaxID=117903 RepID=A0A3S5AAI2_9PLAT|nr:unnamed protein product [Protopolystoma xenopodis]
MLMTIPTTAEHLQPAYPSHPPHPMPQTLQKSTIHVKLNEVVGDSYQGRSAQTINTSTLGARQRAMQEEVEVEDEEEEEEEEEEEDKEQDEDKAKREVKTGRMGTRGWEEKKTVKDHGRGLDMRYAAEVTGFQEQIGMTEKRDLMKEELEPEKQKKLTKEKVPMMRQTQAKWQVSL